MQLDPQVAAAFEALEPAAVAEQVREVLGRAGVSAAEVARRIDWTQPYIARRMTGVVAFSATDLVAIAGALAVEPAALIPTPAASTR